MTSDSEFLILSSFQIAAKLKYESYTGFISSEDIGLILLKHPLDFTAPEVGHICLPTVAAQEGETCYITGWGDTEG